MGWDEEDNRLTDASDFSWHRMGQSGSPNGVGVATIGMAFGRVETLARRDKQRESVKVRSVSWAKPQGKCYLDPGEQF